MPAPCTPAPTNCLASAPQHLGQHGREHQVSLTPPPPGTCNKTLRITGSQTLPSGRTNSFTKDIPLAYTVTASSVDYVIWPAETVAVRQYGDALVGPGYRRVATANTGASIRWAGIEYLTAPAGASGRSLAQSVVGLNTPSPSSCVITSDWARLLAHRHLRRACATPSRAAAAGTTTVHHLVTMQITLNCSWRGASAEPLRTAGGQYSLKTLCCWPRSPASSAASTCGTRLANRRNLRFIHPAHDVVRGDLARVCLSPAAWQLLLQRLPACSGGAKVCSVCRGTTSATAGGSSY